MIVVVFGLEKYHIDESHLHSESRMECTSGKHLRVQTVQTIDNPSAAVETGSGLKLLERCYGLPHRSCGWTYRQHAAQSPLTNTAPTFAAPVIRDRAGDRHSPESTIALHLAAEVDWPAANQPDLQSRRVPRKRSIISG